MDFIQATLPLLGTDFLRANQGEINFSPDFKVFLNGQQIGEIDKTVGAQSNSLGDEISIPPTSTYLAGNISASHTSLDQADVDSLMGRREEGWRLMSVGCQGGTRAGI